MDRRSARGRRGCQDSCRRGPGEVGSGCFRTGEPGDPARRLRSIGQPGPIAVRTRRARRRRDVDRTEKREFVAGLHRGACRHLDDRGHPQHGSHGRRGDGSRRRMRAAGVTFKVAKNRLAHLALEGTQFDGLKPMLKGPTALAWSTRPGGGGEGGRRVRQDQREVRADRRGARHPDAGCVRGAGTGRIAEPGCAARPHRGDDLPPPRPGSPACFRARPGSSLGSLAPLPGRTRRGGRGGRSRRLCMRRGRRTRSGACMEPTRRLN